MIQYISNNKITQEQVSNLGFVKNTELATVNGQSLLQAGADIKVSEETELQYFIKYKVSDPETSPIQEQYGWNIDGAPDCYVIDNQIDEQGNGVVQFNIAPTRVPRNGFRKEGDGILLSVNLPETIRQMSMEAIVDNALTGITLPQSLRETESDSPIICQNLESVRMSGDGSPYKTGENGRYIYRGDTLVIGTRNMPQNIGQYGITKIGSRAYAVQLNYDDLTIPEGIEEIGNVAIINSDIYDLYLPHSIKKLAEAAFRININGQIHYDGTVEEIKHVLIPPNAFSDWGGETIYCSDGEYQVPQYYIHFFNDGGAIPNVSEGDVWEGEWGSATVLHNGDGYLIMDDKFGFPDGIWSGDTSLYYIDRLHTVDDGEILYIGEHAFDGCTSLSGIVDGGSYRLGGQVHIGEYAFRGCSTQHVGFSNYNGDADVVIGDYAFADSQVSAIELNDGFDEDSWETILDDRDVNDIFNEDCFALVRLKLNDGVDTKYYGYNNVPFVGKNSTQGEDGNYDIFNDGVIPDSRYQDWGGYSKAYFFNITEIGHHAFAMDYYDGELEQIYYNGTMSDWNAMPKGEEWAGNQPLETIHCSDGDIDVN